MPRVRGSAGTLELKIADLSDAVRPAVVGSSNAGDETLPICNNCTRSLRYCDHKKELKVRHHGPYEEPQQDDSNPLSVLKGNATLADLFQHYIKNLANWYDLSDATASFEKRVPLEALSRELLFNAIIAFAAIHLSKTTTTSRRGIAERHHEKCVRLLIGLQEKDVEAEDGITLAAVCLLRSYEILGEEFDPNRHLSGAFALAMNRSHNLHQPSLARAGFFNFMREDITYSLINRCPLKIDMEGMDVFEANDDEYQLNVATLHLAKAINQTFGSVTTANSAASMLETLQRWCESLPVQFTSYYETPHDIQSMFPTIRMLRDCHVSVIQYYLVTKSVLGSPQCLRN